MLKRLVAASNESQQTEFASSALQQTLPSISETSVPNQSTAAGRRPSVTQSSRPSIAPTKGPSLVGLFASKKLAKQLSSRIMRKRHGSFMGSSRMSQGIAIQKEPSYRMEPKNKFDSRKVTDCIKDVLEDKLQRFPYNPKFCSNMSRVLSEEIKTKVKAMNFDRYKIICSVLIGQRRDQGIHVTSRCAWDEKLDNQASYTFRNEKIFCTAVVFGVYHE